jgi:hypothetical protein
LAVPDSREVVLFNVGLEELRRVQTPHSMDIVGVLIAKDCLWTYGCDGRVCLFDAESGQFLQEFEVAECAVLSLAVSPDQRTCFAVPLPSIIHMLD